MTNVTVHDYSSGRVVNVPVLDTEMVRLRENFDNGANQEFETFSDYVEAWVAANLVYWG